MEAAGKSTKSAPRRTQAERRATTRAALLEATIDCLVEYGYAGTTTMRIVERAGVSRGAQVHHYPTKAELVAESVRHLALRRAGEFLEEVNALPAGGRQRFEALLDRLWAIHTSPLFAASMELIIAARTDPELRERMVEVEHAVTELIESNMRDLFPEEVKRAEFRAGVDVVMSSMRGLAMLSFADSKPEIERRWKVMRERLLATMAP
jgi:AcrR family transcriptional regulator